MQRITINRRDSAQSGFTLVELLVVMAIIAVIASISVYAIQPFQNRAAVNNGAVLLQSWLTTVKQRAIRDQLPRGLRLFEGDELFDDKGNPKVNLVTKCIFIEQQEDITGAIAFSQGNLVNTVVPFPGNLGPTDYSYIEINGGILRKVTSAATTRIILARPLPTDIPAETGATFRIFRTPKAISVTTDTAAAATDDILRMPQGAVINLDASIQFNATRGFGLTPDTPPLDIMFAPNGSVMFPAPNSDKIILWVTGTQRDANGNLNPLQGQPSLVVINSRTGFISAYAADISTGGNPYSKVP